MAAPSVCVPRVSSSCLLPLASPGDSPTSAGRSDPGSFQLTVPALGPRACEILCTPFQSGVSLFHTSLWKVSPSGLECQTFWGLFFPSRPGSLMWGSDPSLLGENHCSCNYSPICGSPTQGYGPWLYTPTPFLIPVSLCFLLYVFSCWVPVFFINSSSLNCCSFGVPGRGGELRVFLLHHLGNSPQDY